MTRIMRAFLASSMLLLLACGPDQVTLDDSGLDEDGSSLTNCRALPAGPFKLVTLGRWFDGSEDFAFDGRGGMVARRGNSVVRVDATGRVTQTLASLSGQTLGLRYQPDGTLVAAMVGDNKLVSIARNGQVTDLVRGLNGPNGLYVERNSTMWFTEGGGNAVVRRLPDGQRKAFAAGFAVAQGANGVVVDGTRKRLYYTSYDRGEIFRVDLGAANATPQSVWRIWGAGLDGMTLDQCGNLYVVDQRNSKLYRLRTQPTGAAAAAPELLASFPINVSNPQFGLGDGFDAQTVYVSGNPGTLFAVNVGVAGQPTFVPAP